MILDCKITNSKAKIKFVIVYLSMTTIALTY